ncbi:MAG: hypothetical protein ACOYXC_03225 [Candidatus Rifleibacteriota bacterium]
MDNRSFQKIWAAPYQKGIFRLVGLIRFRSSDSHLSEPFEDPFGLKGNSGRRVFGKAFNNSGGFFVGQSFKYKQSCYS